MGGLQTRHIWRAMEGLTIPGVGKGRVMQVNVRILGGTPGDTVTATLSGVLEGSQSGA